MAIKAVIGYKGKALQKELGDDESKFFYGKKIGDKVPGEKLGFAGYEFEISGGSDHCGFPMAKDVDGFQRKRILAVSHTGLKKELKGIRKRKTVCGNTVHPKISQVNLKIIKEGVTPLIEEPKEEPKSEEAPEEKKEEAPEKKEESEEKKEEPKEEKKEAPEEKKE